MQEGEWIEVDTLDREWIEAGPLKSDRLASYTPTNWAASGEYYIYLRLIFLSVKWEEQGHLNHVEVYEHLQ